MSDTRTLSMKDWADSWTFANRQDEPVRPFREYLAGRRGVVMATDGNRGFYTDLADKNLGQATAAGDELRAIRKDQAGHSKADVDREERAAKDAIGRAADAIRILVDVGD